MEEKEKNSIRCIGAWHGSSSFLRFQAFGLLHFTGSCLSAGRFAFLLGIQVSRAWHGLGWSLSLFSLHVQHRIIPLKYLLVDSPIDVRMGQ